MLFLTGRHLSRTQPLLSIVLLARQDRSRRTRTSRGCATVSHKSAAEADRLVSKYLDSPLAVLLSTQESIRIGIEIGRFVIRRLVATITSYEDENVIPCPRRSRFWTRRRTIGGPFSKIVSSRLDAFISRWCQCRTPTPPRREGQGSHLSAAHWYCSSHLPLRLSVQYDVHTSGPWGSRADCVVHENHQEEVSSRRLRYA
jgi:hypothetical protein